MFNIHKMYLKYLKLRVTDKATLHKELQLGYKEVIYWYWKIFTTNLSVMWLQNA